MSNYGKFCPIAKAASVLSERWTLLILREMMSGSTRFNELERGLPGISRALLAKRLRTLLDCGIIQLRDSDVGRPGYVLSDRGLELRPIVIGIGNWGQRWLNAGVTQDEVDTDLLMWDIHRRIDLNELPSKRFVVQLDFHGISSKTYWLVFEDGESSLCHDPPGFDSNILVECDTISMHNVWLGRADLITMMQQDAIRVIGSSAESRAFVRALRFSVFAHVPYAGTS